MPRCVVSRPTGNDPVPSADFKKKQNCAHGPCSYRWPASLYVSTQNGRVLRAPLPRIHAQRFNGDAKVDLVWRAMPRAPRDVAGRGETRRRHAIRDQKKKKKPRGEWKLVGAGRDFDADGKSDPWCGSQHEPQVLNTIWRLPGQHETRGIAVPTLTDQAWKAAGSRRLRWRRQIPDLILAQTRVPCAAKVWYSASARHAFDRHHTRPTCSGVLGGCGATFDGDRPSPICLWRNTVTARHLRSRRSAHSQTPRAIASDQSGLWKIVRGRRLQQAMAPPTILWRNSKHGARTRSGKSANNTRVQAVVRTVTNPNWKVVRPPADYDNRRHRATWSGPAKSNTRAKSVVASTPTTPRSGRCRRSAATWSVQPYEAQALMR
jgi:hypothetical protein